MNHPMNRAVCGVRRINAAFTFRAKTVQKTSTLTRSPKSFEYTTLISPKPRSKTSPSSKGFHNIRPPKFVRQKKSRKTPRDMDCGESTPLSLSAPKSFSNQKLFSTPQKHAQPIPAPTETSKEAKPLTKHH
jgi:hypothetical protein